MAYSPTNEASGIHGIFSCQVSVVHSVPAAHFLSQVAKCLCSRAWPPCCSRKMPWPLCWATRCVLARSVAAGCGLTDRGHAQQIGHQVARHVAEKQAFMFLLMFVDSIMNVLFQTPMVVTQLFRYVETVGFIAYRPLKPAPGKTLSCC